MKLNKHSSNIVYFLYLSYESNIDLIFLILVSKIIFKTKKTPEDYFFYWKVIFKHI
jgi:hypothetical protein